ncbi:uncharacterized protein PHA67_001666 [Liasis olivaceus]
MRLFLWNPSIAHHIHIVLKVLWLPFHAPMALLLFKMFLGCEKKEIVFLAPLVTTAGEGGWRDHVPLASSAKRGVLMPHHRVTTSLGLPWLTVYGEKYAQAFAHQDSTAQKAQQHPFHVQMTPWVLPQVPSKEETVCPAHQVAGAKQNIPWFFRVPLGPTAKG